jgi:hypothetical protein
MIDKVDVWAAFEVVFVLPHVAVVEIEELPIRMVRKIENVSNKKSTLAEKLIPLPHCFGLRFGQRAVVDVSNLFRVFVGPLPVR